MDMLQRKMEELQRQYMQEKETLRVDLVQTLFNARKLQQQEAEAEAGVSPAMLQLRQQQEHIQQQINAQLRQEQLQQPAVPPGPSGPTGTVFSPPPSGQLLQPVPARCQYSSLPLHPSARYAYLPAQHQPQLVTLGNGQTVQLVSGPLGAQQLVSLPGQQFYSVQQVGAAALAQPPPQEQLLPPAFAPPPRVSPRQQEAAGEEEDRLMDRLDCASVMSEPARPAQEQVRPHGLTRVCWTGMSDMPKCLPQR
jgi:hypothetical protein